MNNLLSYCGLVDPRISASDKDLPVPHITIGHLDNQINHAFVAYYLTIKEM